MLNFWQPNVRDVFRSARTKRSRRHRNFQWWSRPVIGARRHSGQDHLGVMARSIISGHDQVAMSTSWRLYRGSIYLLRSCSCGAASLSRAIRGQSNYDRVYVRRVACKTMYQWQLGNPGTMRWLYRDWMLEEEKGFRPEIYFLLGAGARVLASRLTADMFSCVVNDDVYLMEEPSEIHICKQIRLLCLSGVTTRALLRSLKLYKLANRNRHRNNSIVQWLRVHLPSHFWRHLVNISTATTSISANGQS